MAAFVGGCGVWLDPDLDDSYNPFEDENYVAEVLEGPLTREAAWEVAREYERSRPRDEVIAEQRAAYRAKMERTAEIKAAKEAEKQAAKQAARAEREAVRAAAREAAVESARAAAEEKKEAVAEKKAVAAAEKAVAKEVAVEMKREIMEKKAAAIKIAEAAAEDQAAAIEAAKAAAQATSKDIKTTASRMSRADSEARSVWTNIQGRHAQKTGFIVSHDKLGPFELIYDIKCGKHLCHHCLEAVGTEPDCYYNHLGYFIGNIVPACRKCNRMKGPRRPDVFYSIAAGIVAARTQSDYTPDLNVFQTSKSIAAHHRRYYRTNEATFGEDFWPILHSLPCYYCGRPECNGIDRLVPRQKNGGYDEPNCVPCCKTCNMTKSSLGYIDFIKQCGSITRATREGRPGITSYTDSIDFSNGPAVAGVKRRRLDEVPGDTLHRNIKLYTGYTDYQASLRTLKKHPGTASKKEMRATMAVLRDQCRETPLLPMSQ